MDLWIRSQTDYQEQNLIKAKQVKVELVINDIWTINVNGIRVAEYKSRERAIEVLNEIQDKLCLSLGCLEYPLRIIKRPDNTMDVQQLKADVLVYQMPADDEVK